MGLTIRHKKTHRTIGFHVRGFSARARKLHSNTDAAREELIRKADALVGKTVYMLSGNGCILRGYIASANLLPLGVYLLVERPGLGDMRVRAEEIDETVFSSYEKVLEMMNTKGV